MLGTIFTFETKRWFKNIAFYIYFVLFFTLAFFVMASAVGYFDVFTTTTASVTVRNSPIAINTLLNALSQLINFIVPTVIGATVYRDFKYNTHTLLYSYPFNKFDYLIGKFLSGFITTIIITFSIGLGFIIASALPFANEDLLGPFNLWAYFQGYVLFVIPNIFFIGALIFMLVTLTRNLYVGFIFVIALLFIGSIIGMATKNMDDKFIAALIEPYGAQALSYITKYWSIEDQNTLNIPFDSVILYNRLIWIGVGVVALIVTYFSFSFTHQPLTLSFKRKKKGTRLIKNNFGSIIKINLPKVQYNFSFGENIKTALRLSRLEFKAIVNNWIFISILIILMIFIGVAGLFLGQELYGTKTYPVTWKIINEVGANINLFVRILIFLFAGVLLNAAAGSRMNLLVDSTPVPNWALLLSKFIALIKMVFLIYAIGIVSCILVQTYYGYYNFEILHYLKEFFIFDFAGCLVLIIYSLFIQSLFRNYLIGFFVILVSFMLPLGLSKIGLELDIYHFNSSPGVSYSDMDGYGSVREFFYYRLYWLLLCGIFYGLTLLLWRRGILSGVKERLQLAGQRFKAPIAVPVIILFIGFIGLGYAIYYQETKLEPYYTSQEYEKMIVDFEKKYKKYETYPQPRITDVKVDLNLFPEQRNYNATARFVMVNKSDKAIDSLFLNYGKNLQSVVFDKANQLVLKDTVMDFNIYKLNQPLQPGEVLNVTIQVKNQSNTWLKDRSPVIGNGTFVNNGSLFPSFGYNESIEIADNDVRKKYNLPPKERMANPTDMKARMNTYISKEADWITFETIVSTSNDQIAIAPGYLQKEWEKDGRRYFHYKMDQKMLNFYAFNSGRYEVKREKWEGINLEIYYHKGHEYNLDRMMNGLKKSLAYYSENFSPYQHKQARIIEFPSVMGTFAQAFANTMPFSEAIGFIADVDENDPNAVDYPFSVVSHEMAHQWWAHQVIGADVKGATLLSESLAEYSSLKVLEHRYGKSQMHKFLKDALDSYLRGRTYEWKEENPLMYNENQQYIHYNKGSLVLYALSDYLGEKNFNNILKGFVSEVAFQDAPYTTSIELVDHIRKGTPDSLQYLISDMFENITLYDNKVNNVTVKPLKNGKYQVDIDFIVSKYRSGTKGEKTFKDAAGRTLHYKDGKKDIQSYPLNDYIEIGIFGEKTASGNHLKDNELYLKKYKIDKINNNVSVIVDKKPTEVGIDPYNKLIDTDSNDNRQSVK